MKHGYRSRRRGGGVEPERGRSGSNGGFTLVEVLVAMVILAIGLMGLQALGIGAARALALADRRSGYATLASDSLASALLQLRRGEVPSQFCVSGPRDGERVGRTVDFSDASLASVSVTVEADSDSASGAESFTIRSSLFLPSGLSGITQGGGCG